MTLISRVHFHCKLHPLARDLWLTAGSQVLILVVNLLLVALFGRLIGTVALGEYLLLRRVVNGLQSGVQMGLGVAVPRFVARSINRKGQEREAYFLAGLSCLISFAICSALLLSAGRQFFARWLLGNSQLIHLVLPLSLWLLALATHTAVYGYYRGILAMGRANSFQLVNLALVPLVAVLALFRTHSVGLIMSCMAASMLVGAGLFSAPIFHAVLVKGHDPDLPRYAAELLRYGVPRVPGEFGAGALLAAGPMVVSHYRPMAEVSYLLLGLSLLVAVGYAAAPIGLVLLSKVSMMLAQGRFEEVRGRLVYLVTMTLELSVFIGLQLLVFNDVLVNLWVGRGFQEATGVIRILMLAIPAHLLYVVLGSVIDAASPLPYDSRNVFISFATLLVLAGFVVKIGIPTLLLDAMACTMVVALFVLAALSLHTVMRLYDVRVEWIHSVVPVLIGVLFAAASISIHSVRGLKTGFIELAFIQSTMGLLFLGLLRKWRSPWLAFLWAISLGRAALDDRAISDSVSEKKALAVR